MDITKEDRWEEVESPLFLLLFMEFGSEAKLLSISPDNDDDICIEIADDDPW